MVLYLLSGIKPSIIVLFPRYNTPRSKWAITTRRAAVISASLCRPRVEEGAVVVGCSQASGLGPLWHYGSGWLMVIFPQTRSTAHAVPNLQAPASTEKGWPASKGRTAEGIISVAGWQGGWQVRREDSTHHSREKAPPVEIFGWLPVGVISAKPARGSVSLI